MANKEDRAVSTLIGFILLFGVLIVTFSIYQGFVVPEQNRGVEFRHNEKVQGQILDLHDAIRLTGTTGVSQSTSITVGADYPERTLAVNFGLTGGQIRTEDANAGGSNNITFENVTAISSEVEDYWYTSKRDLEFRTKDIVYSPVYSHYQNAPDTVISNTAVFKQFDSANLSIADQILVQGNQITIVAINGSFDEGTSGQGSSISLRTQPLSVAKNSIAVESNDTARNITLTVPTTVEDGSAWNESSLEDQDTISDVSLTGSNVRIELKDQRFTVRMMKVGIGTGTTDPGAEYLTEVNPPGRTVSKNSSTKVTLEVRDRLNNPVSGVRVDGIIDSTDVTPSNRNGTLSVISESQSTNKSGVFVDANSTSNGQVAFEYTAPNVTGSSNIGLKFDIGTEDREEVIVNMTILPN